MLTHGEGAGGEEGLGFDLRTILLEVLGRWWILAMAVVVAAPLAVGIALKLGKRQFEAQSILLYRPIALVPSTDGSDEATVALTSLVNLVKLPANIEEARRRLELPVSVPALGASIHAWIQGKTDLLVISAVSDTPQGAADLCRVVRDLFLLDQAKRMRQDGARTLRKQRDRALLELQTAEKQAKDLDGRIAELRNQVERERAAARRRPSSSELERRYRHVQEGIREDSAVRRNAIELARTEQEYKRAAALAEKGSISSQQLASAQSAYDQAKVAARDSAEIQALRAQVGLLPSGDGASGQLTASELMLQQALARSVELGLKWVEAKEKANYLDLEAQRVESAELDPVTSPSSFQIMAEPNPPTLPKKSTRRLLFAGAFVGIMLVAMAFVVARAALTSRIRSPAELRLKLPIRALGALPLASRRARPLVAAPAPEIVRLVVARLREHIESSGYRLLVTSPGYGEGRSVVSRALAAGLARRDVRVLLVDLNLPGRRDEDRGRERDDDHPADHTLAQVLEGKVTPADMEAPRHPDGYDILPPVDRPVEPEFLGTNELHELLAEASSRYQCVLIDGPPVLPRSDLELVAKAIDGAVLVIRANMATGAQVKRAHERLVAAKIPVLGAILNGVHRRHLDRDDASGGTT